MEPAPRHHLTSSLVTTTLRTEEAMVTEGHVSTGTLKKIFIYLIFDCPGSSLLCMGFL